MLAVSPPTSIPKTPEVIARLGVQLLQAPTWPRLTFGTKWWEEMEHWPELPELIMEIYWCDLNSDRVALAFGPKMLHGADFPRSVGFSPLYRPRFLSGGCAIDNGPDSVDLAGFRQRSYGIRCKRFQSPRPRLALNQRQRMMALRQQLQRMPLCNTDTCPSPRSEPLRRAGSLPDLAAASYLRSMAAHNSTEETNTFMPYVHPTLALGFRKLLEFTSRQEDNSFIFLRSERLL